MSTRAQQQAKLDAIITDLANDLKSAVAKIEADKIPTTRFHYGDYLNLISVASHGDKRVAGVIVAALLAAGANRQGVTDAYKIYAG